jgi:hypothetical protein
MRSKCCNPRYEVACFASTSRIHFSGEPFGRRDIQFHDPQIGVE